jgi:hypothetical protein
MISGYVLDVAALVGACTGEPYPEAVVWGIVQEDGVLAIPAAVLAEAHADIPPSQHDVLAVILDLPNTVVVGLDRDAARRCGTLLTRLDAADRARVSAAQATAEGVGRRWPIATGRAELLSRMDPTVDADTMP